MFGFSDSVPSWKELYVWAGLNSPVYKDNDSVSVHFIDVGQGDCTLIRTGERDILIDCGEYDRYPDVARYLSGVGIDELDTVIATHPHSDHIGGMFRIIRRFGAKEIIMPEVPEEMIPVTGSYTKLEEAVKQQDIPVRYARPGDTIDTGGIGTITVTAPVSGYDDLNDYSVVVRYSCGDISFLFCGDIESAAEADILGSGTDIGADVIKVPHHGSSTSSTRMFVQTVSPEYAVFCVGQENDFSHPHGNIVDLYENLGAKIYRSDINGDIVFVTDGKELSVITEKTRKEAA